MIRRMSRGATYSAGYYVQPLQKASARAAPVEEQITTDSLRPASHEPRIQRRARRCAVDRVRRKVEFRDLREHNLEVKVEALKEREKGEGW